MTFGLRLPSYMALLIVSLLQCFIILNESNKTYREGLGYSSVRREGQLQKMFMIPCPWGTSMRLAFAKLVQGLGFNSQHCTKTKLNKHTPCLAVVKYEHVTIHSSVGCPIGKLVYGCQRHIILLSFMKQVKYIRIV